MLRKDGVGLCLLLEKVPGTKLGVQVNLLSMTENRTKEGKAHLISKPL